MTTFTQMIFSIYGATWWLWLLIFLGGVWLAWNSERLGKSRKEKNILLQRGFYLLLIALTVNLLVLFLKIFS